MRENDSRNNQQSSTDGISDQEAAFFHPPNQNARKNTSQGSR